MNLFDRAVAWADPIIGLRRAQARKALAYYEATQPGRMRKNRVGNPSPNQLTSMSGKQLRDHARYLERNHDLTRGALRTMVNNIVGPNGIGIEPQPKRMDGSIHEEYAAGLREITRQWRRRPEVTHKMHAAQMERMICYSWIRDGECFEQKVIGQAPGLLHGSALPFSLEVLEADFVPLDYTDTSRSIRQGIQVNAWGRPINYVVYKGDPREGMTWLSPGDLKFVPAGNVIHVSTLDRLHQDRGVSEFASVLTRIEDLKDYEESERIAAKVAASLTAYVRRAAPSEAGYTGPMEDPKTGEALARELFMEPGMILEGLAPGEDIGLIDSNRPNPNLVSWRAGQLRAYAAGLGASYSSISRDYNGTYSALRQELVEQWVHYAVLTDDFIGMHSQPVHSTIVQVSHLSGLLPIPKDVKPGTEDECLFIGQSMPWIDPLKEAQAWLSLVQAGFASEVEVIRRRGGNPRDVLDQVSEFRNETAKRALMFNSNAATKTAGLSPTDPPAVAEE
ncbi:lambda family phage portal protein [Comamonas sp. BIGb0124]|uniref:phage portal protein n=1 Tax=Comamonas sp. BIGb0124 TaxID=2485130 RepID=UPI000F483AF7|nr:phage portal protein [Comamonas sp. BIGb0124]ROR25153.1 lambda family phage portal protein [Comamonas sp. BIGb0124]